MLGEEQIRAVSTDAAYKRGLRYFEYDAVKEIRRAEDGTFLASVLGTEDYKVRVRLTKEEDDVESFRCDCPAAVLYPGACKHVVAVLKVSQAQQRHKEESLYRHEKQAASETDAGGRRLLQHFGDARAAVLPVPQKPVYLVPRLFVTSASNGVEKLTFSPFMSTSPP